MKILTISDDPSQYYYDYYKPGMLEDFDLIISCGDLSRAYLEFLVTMAHCPLLYVHGNHDERYQLDPPEGCQCIDDRLVVYNGVRILGLGGCLRYHPGPFQYTEAQMRRRIAMLRLALRRTGGVDIVVTHAPPRGLGDQEDPAHIGFQALVDLIDRYHPQYLLHGHVHLRYNPDLPRIREYEDTKIINVSERYVLDVPERETSPRDKNRLIWKTPHRDVEKIRPSWGMLS